MKAQTLKNKINEHLTTKNGSLKVSFSMLFEFIEKGGKYYGKTNKAHKAICFELAKSLHVQNNEGFRKYLYELAK